MVLFTAAIVLLAACKKNLDTKTLNEWDPEDVWRIPELAEGVLMDVYNSLPTRPDNFDGNFLDAATDNGVTNRYTNVYKAGMGGITAQDNPLANWGDCYAQLQTINLFLEKGLTDQLLYDRVSTEADARIKARLKGEALFLRAWYSFSLLQRNGGKTASGAALGYPIIDHFLSDSEGRDMETYERASYQQCVTQIMADCDSAIRLLPFVYSGTDVVTGTTQTGRASGGAALVLKSRVALYGASPAYQDDAVVLLNDMGNFTVVDAQRYNTQWVMAALVADTALRTSGFGSFTGIKATDLADAATTTPAEFVWRKFFNSNDMESRHFPPYYRGSGQTAPSQNLVEAFPAKNGFPVTDSRSGYDPANPDPSLVARDNRMNLNVYYQGRTFGAAGGKIDVVYGGKDSRSFHAAASRSGYYLAKFLSNKDNMLNPVQTLTAIHYYPLLRKAEVFLNYAEAANEAWGPHTKGPGCQYTAYEVIRSIRNLSGGITSTTYLDEMAASKESFRTLIQNERRLELAFENHRFFDLRRWLLPLNESIKALEVTRQEDGTLVYRVQELEARNLNDIRYYYLPLPQNELLKSKKLVNNLGW
ncbi:MAG: RagB/SusD family nutrient uptake outer membrane protein [Candidatus Pseudobacter hemicellulosilyticus]|uniref:RagB/SusD family nutrient uptake outer membrane protein n=1 Tax=Candidatus Pseudobacter hemicellulosilyticus TaxID=3121375 RepID=A0AAJ5WXF1_9BACT|nr:MAG: RagB/SusD family nutrient uptake outer membrane protein [Pseudobacter sp.]